MQIGTDIIAIDRIEKSLKRFNKKFLNRLFTKDEQNRLNIIKIESVAGYWASKEAISKALGCGIGKDLSFLDIIIYKDKRGKPYFKLSKIAQNRFKIEKSSLSISHDSNFAIAVVIIKLDS
jgi:holo-[acyl-carrier protein] synthase